MRSLDDSVRRLEDLGSRLNKATDKLNEQIEAFEDRLSAARIGIEVWLDDEADRILADPIRAAEDAFYDIGWAKIGDSWRIATRKLTWNDEWERWNYSAPQPLTNAPRHVRMLGLPLVLRIVESLGNEAERWLQDVEKALNGVPELPLAPPPDDDDIPF